MMIAYLFYLNPKYLGYFSRTWQDQRPKEIIRYPPENPSLIDNFGQNGVLSFHYYDEISTGHANLTPHKMGEYKAALKGLLLNVVLSHF
jgi:hypothetical protein